MSDTIFHKIAAKQAPAYIISENEQFMAFLDIFPAFYGQTIVISKTQSPTSRFSATDPEVLKGLMEFGQQVAKLIESKIEDIDRCVAVIEGFDVDYLHLKLFPAGKLTRGKEVLFEPPQRASDEALSKLQTLLTS